MLKQILIVCSMAILFSTLCSFALAFTNEKLNLSSVVSLLLKDKSNDTPITVLSSKVNDTGVRSGASYPSGNNSSCIGVTANAQDCSQGRDATYNDNSDGLAGFSFTKLDNNGIPLVDQNATYEATPWQCVRDNFTGLIWEVKTDDGGLHDKDHRYTWYNTNTAINGGSNGVANIEDVTSLRSGDMCFGYNSGDSSTFCNTETYVANVNKEGLCGRSDWRQQFPEAPNRTTWKLIFSCHKAF